MSRPNVGWPVGLERSGMISEAHALRCHRLPVKAEIGQRAVGARILRCARRYACA